MSCFDPLIFNALSGKCADILRPALYDPIFLLVTFPYSSSNVVSLAKMQHVINCSYFNCYFIFYVICVTFVHTTRRLVEKFYLTIFSHRCKNCDSSNNFM